MSSIRTVRRSATDSKVAGLCGGIAEQWGVDPVLVRVGAVLLALSGGIGVVLYGAGWLMIPIEGQTRTQLDDMFPRISGWPRELKLGLVAVACIVVGALLAPVLPFGFGSALILAAIWYFGYYRHRDPNRTGAEDRQQLGPRQAGSGGPPPIDRSKSPAEGFDYFTFSGPATPFTEAAQAWQQRMRDYERGPGDALSAARPGFDAEQNGYPAHPDPVGLYRPDPVPAPAASMRRTHRADSLPARRLRLASLLILGLSLTGLAIAVNLGVHVGTTIFLATALLVAGLTLVVASRVGRARGVLPVALLLAIATVASSVVGNGMGRPGIGVHQVSYADGAALPPAENWNSGRLTVDLSRLSLQTSRTFTAHVDNGSLTVIAPADTRVRVDSTVDDGYLRVDDQKGSWGSELEATTSYAGPNAAPSSPTLTIHASVDQGTLEVRR